MTIHIVPTEFPTVQDAIDNFSTVAGDSIQILAGTFDGFNVTKERLKIFGCGIGKTIIAGNPSPVSDNGIDIDADYTLLQGFTIQGFSDGGIEANSDFNVLKEIESKLNDNDGYEIDGQNNLFINCSALLNRFGGFDVDDDHHCLINCVSVGNRDEGYDIDGNNNKFIRSVGNESGETGFDIGGEDSNILFENQSFRNRVLGINIRQGSMNNNIIGNKVCKNEGSGIKFAIPEFEQTIGNVVDSNIVRKNGTEIGGSGILVENGVLDNSIRFNKLKLNEPNDIEVQGLVTDNIYDGNKCENSSPNGLCN
ncbi:hypothetical protein [Bacillus solimangrovi]|uniref:Right handed beta helix domain-containing protein n=1 Tax=Bacillus solimangrovi TaxID=1305675 RepID=A0A1E5LIA8_9BACI|nr:hypothetical protein [Bacillus solimangrovi]OEH93786.1 hypothetical protein BFG57_11430 [Bacillus solimangrovi]